MIKNKIIYSLGLITSITTPLAFVSALNDPKPPTTPGEENKPKEKPKTTDLISLLSEKNDKKISETISNQLIIVVF